MNVKVLVEGGTPETSEGRQTLLSYINSNQYDEIVYDNSREHEVAWFREDDFIEKIYPALEKTKTFLICFLNGERNYDEFLETHPYVKIIRTPHHFFRHTYDDYNRKIQDIRNYSVDKFETNFIYLNGKPHPYRCHLMDLFQASNKMKNYKYTWCWTQKDMGKDPPVYIFHNWDEVNVHHEEGINKNTIIDQTKLDVDLKPFAQLISESQIDYFFLTEKTVKALLLKQPFLVYGSVGYHQKLKEMGFQLYDELFDYSFDSIEDSSIRGQLIIKEFEKISEVDTKEMYKILEPKVIHNLNKSIEIKDSYQDNKEIVDYIKERIEFFRNALVIGNMHCANLKKLIL